MSTGDEITAPERAAGPFTHARFWRCALQINPAGYAGAYRGADHGLSQREYLEALLEVCQDEDIRVLGLADHGSVEAVDAFRQFFAPHGIVVFPGFEVATAEKVHWVCLFPEDTSTARLQRCLGALELMDPQDGVRPSKLSGEQLLQKVEEWGGFCYAAHVTHNSGLLREKMAHLWSDPRLKAAQIPGPEEDLPSEYKAIARNRDPAYRRERKLALINAKDVARPEDLRDPAASCYVKMTRPSFEAFLVAFKDPESRIRLHHQITAQHYSRIERITVDGGYLDGLDVRLSEHLNTLIGGRGTGKSTLLESLRYALGLEHEGAQARRQGDAVVRENLGRAHARVQVELVSAEQRMNRYTVIRRYGEPPRVVDADGNESTLQPLDLVPEIEIYGQNEIYEIARDRAALIQVLRRFLPDREAQQRQLEQLRNRLRENAQKLLKARAQDEALAAELASLPKLEEQVEQFRALGLEEKLQQVPLLERERQLRGRLLEELQGAGSGIAALRDALPDLAFLEEAAVAALPHAEALRRARGVLERVTATLQGRMGEMEAALATGQQELQAIAAELTRAERAAEDALEREFAKLPEVAGKPGREVGRTYQSLLRRIEQTRPLRVRQRNVRRLRRELEQERRNLLGELSDLRNARTRALEQAARKLNRKLEGKLRIRIVPGGNRKALKHFLLQLPGIGESGVSWVDTAQDLTVRALVEAIAQGPEALREKGWSITAGRAETLCGMTPEQRLELEAVDLEDEPVFELNVAHQGENFRALERLSTGQQCTAILHVLLLENRDPLIMDQPEDNLDNAFIADRIVRELRGAKTRRQFLFATHNANIPVFGDAEWIGVFSATDSHGGIPLERQGSIDVPEIRDEVSQILEGGRDAFIQRKEKYGY